MASVIPNEAALVSDAHVKEFSVASRHAHAIDVDCFSIDALKKIDVNSLAQ
jgi:hypothetical protein